MSLNNIFHPLGLERTKELLDTSAWSTSPARVIVSYSGQGELYLPNLELPGKRTWGLEKHLKAIGDTREVSLVVGDTWIPISWDDVAIIDNHNLCRIEVTGFYSRYNGKFDTAGRLP